MVCAMLTLALDDSTETADPKLHTVMFNIYSLEKGRAVLHCGAGCHTQVAFVL